MPKLVGLSQQNMKYLEVCPFPKEEMPCAVLLFGQAKSFYRIFKKNFGDGFRAVADRRIPNTEDLGACLVNYHLSIELMLKGLICLKHGSFDKNLETHDLIILLEKARALYPALSKIENNTDCVLLLRELSNSFNTLRYAEGSICLSHNKKQGWNAKAPLNELSELLDKIFSTLLRSFEDALQPSSDKTVQSS